MSTSTGVITSSAAHPAEPSLEPSRAHALPATSDITHATATSGAQMKLSRPLEAASTVYIPETSAGVSTGIISSAGIHPPVAHTPALAPAAALKNPPTRASVPMPSAFTKSAGSGGSVRPALTSGVPQFVPDLSTSTVKGVKSLWAQSKAMLSRHLPNYRVSLKHIP